MEIYFKPTNVITTRLGIQPDGPVHAFFTSQCAKHMDKYVPFDEGNLADYHLEGNDKIVYDQPYARYQYYGIRGDGTHEINPANRNRNYHPLATSYWDRHMVSAEMGEIEQELQDFMKRGG